jgi:hypothetical protein
MPTLAPVERPWEVTVTAEEGAVDGRAEMVVVTDPVTVVMTELVVAGRTVLVIDAPRAEIVAE